MILWLPGWWPGVFGGQIYGEIREKMMNQNGSLAEKSPHFHGDEEPWNQKLCILKQSQVTPCLCNKVTPPPTHIQET